MAETHTFRFADDALNDLLMDRLGKQAPGRYRVDRQGVIRYSHADEQLIGNEIICSVRSSVFDSWQIVSFPDEWEESYRDYMTEHGVPFRAEIRDGRVRFLIPGNYRPHLWKLNDPRTARTTKAAM